MKRYIRVIEQYISADGDIDAISKCRKFEMEQNKLYDNNTVVVQLFEANFGELEPKEILINK